MTIEAKFTVETIKSFKQATLSIVKEKPHVAIIEATSTYIPIDQFKEIFMATGELVKARGIKTLIFDKRNLTVFHQPSMEWYFVDWKEQMFRLGLDHHIKILPKDEVFRYSVKIGREKINLAYPEGKFHQMRIDYAETLEEAVNRV
jgi:hypothetical protein